MFWFSFDGRLWGTGWLGGCFLWSGGSWVAREGCGRIACQALFESVSADNGVPGLLAIELFASSMSIERGVPGLLVSGVAGLLGNGVAGLLGNGVAGLLGNGVPDPELLDSSIVMSSSVGTAAVLIVSGVLEPKKGQRSVSWGNCLFHNQYTKNCENILCKYTLSR
ncbi:hypothetical protein NP493_4560g00000 [Ridgeia piscesae]|uniref:Uncharacterized protein n=1 Tax=Ridgeia piscesae TaxID=27915 RepID=A0AAD9IYJ8_RIDPI|nr:hypothetical protein NP493_4560g00000 [Ridgeia piscesae]